jgi:hypothetical protein
MARSAGSTCLVGSTRVVAFLNSRARISDCAESRCDRCLWKASWRWKGGLVLSHCFEIGQARRIDRNHDWRADRSRIQSRQEENQDKEAYQKAQSSHDTVNIFCSCLLFRDRLARYISFSSWPKPGKPLPRMLRLPSSTPYPQNGVCPNLSTRPSQTSRPCLGRVVCSRRSS